MNILSPATRGYLDMNGDWAAFVDLAKGTTVEISGGLSDLYVRDYTGQKTARASIEMLRAAASAAWQSGVTSLHLFNYDAHATGKGKPGTLFSPDELQALKEMGDPEKITRKDKHYYMPIPSSGRNAPAEPSWDDGESPKSWSGPVSSWLHPQPRMSPAAISWSTEAGPRSSRPLRALQYQHPALPDLPLHVLKRASADRRPSRLHAGTARRTQSPAQAAVVPRRL